MSYVHYERLKKYTFMHYRFMNSKGALYRLIYELYERFLECSNL